MKQNIVHQFPVDITSLRSSAGSISGTIDVGITFDASIVTTWNHCKLNPYLCPTSKIISHLQQIEFINIKEKKIKPCHFCPEFLTTQSYQDHWNPCETLFVQQVYRQRGLLDKRRGLDIFKGF